MPQHAQPPSQCAQGQELYRCPGLGRILTSGISGPSVCTLALLYEQVSFQSGFSGEVTVGLMLPPSTLVFVGLGEQSLKCLTQEEEGRS